jgi:single-stranded-DNA-specific exonuclease
VSGCDTQAVAALVDAGVSPLAARVLCSRGYDTPEKVSAFLQTGQNTLHDPLLMADMDKAAARVKQAMDAKERIAVYGDYDVDGITATCLLTDFLTWQGANVTHYIPARMEEGYGLNEMAVRQLASEGVRLIVTVDCGITAMDEALLCRELGMDLVITDHHECRGTLPDAVAVVDPHRKDCGYPFPTIAGVGVAFKLAAAIYGDQGAMLERYCDLVSLGTVADVMPLLDENRTLVCAGLDALRQRPRLGLQLLMQECGCDRKAITASTIGYVLAPRINAAGRMGQVDLATELFLTRDAHRAAELAEALCRLNRQRQAVETEIYDDAVAQLVKNPPSGTIVLAGNTWHQGVVGIVASRLAEEYGCPTFLICLDGPKGKASSRSYGGFNLYASLEQLSDLLESYGGHELAAGFTILESQIAPFRTAMSALAADFVASGKSSTALELDCSITDPSLLTQENVAALDLLEPTGAGCPRPTFYMTGLVVDRLTEVGGGKHLKLRLRCGHHYFSAIFFSMTAVKSGIMEGDTVEIAFTPQVNEFRGTRSVQLSLVDIRPAESIRQTLQQDHALYAKHRAGRMLSAREARALLPPRTEFVAVWKYLKSHCEDGCVHEECGCLSRKISRFAGFACPVSRTRVCLDVFCERGLLDLEDNRRSLTIKLTDSSKKVDLNQSSILLELQELASHS